MNGIFRIGRCSLSVLIASIFLSFACIRVAQAAVTITVTETGGNVVATANGTLNLAALAFNTNMLADSIVRAVTGWIVVGTPPAPTLADAYTAPPGPLNFGPGNFVVADAGTGDKVGVTGVNIWVPTGYVSGAPLAGTATWNAQTLATLGLTPGTYTWSWGAGPTADSLTVSIVTPPPAAAASIPTLSEWGMIILSSLMAIGAILTLRRRQP